MNGSDPAKTGGGGVAVGGESLSLFFSFLALKNNRKEQCLQSRMTSASQPTKKLLVKEIDKKKDLLLKNFRAEPAPDELSGSSTSATTTTGSGSEVASQSRTLASGVSLARPGMGVEVIGPAGSSGSVRPLERLAEGEQQPLVYNRLEARSKVPLQLPSRRLSRQL